MFQKVLKAVQCQVAAVAVSSNVHIDDSNGDSLSQLSAKCLCSVRTYY